MHYLDRWAVALALLPFAAVAQVAPDAALLQWTPPTTYEDGAPLTVAGYKVYWGTAAGSYPNSFTLNNPSATSYTVQPLTAATWTFVVTAFDAGMNESRFSNSWSKTIVGPPLTPPGPVSNLNVTPTTAQPVSVTISNRSAANDFDFSITGVGPVTIALSGALAFDWCRIGTVNIPTNPALGANGDGINSKSVIFTAPIVGGRCDADPSDALAGTVTVQGVTKPLVNVAGVWSVSFP